MNIRFYHCPICGNIVVKITDSGRNLSCCGKEMVELVSKEMEEGNEKHLPFLSSVKDNILTVEIGEKPSHGGGAPYPVGISGDREGRTVRAPSTQRSPTGYLLL